MIYYNIIINHMNAKDAIKALQALQAQHAKNREDRNKALYKNKELREYKIKPSPSSHSQPSSQPSSQPYRVPDNFNLSQEEKDSLYDDLYSFRKKKSSRKIKSPKSRKIKSRKQMKR